MTSTPLAAPESIVERFVDAARRRPLVLDAVLAAAVVLVGLIQVPATVTSDLTGESLLLLLIASVPIVLRRRFPMPAAITTAVVCVLGVLLVATPGAVLPALVMGYSATAYGPRWAGPLTAVVILVGAVGGVLPQTGIHDPTLGLELLIFVVLGLLVGLCTWLAGALRRAQRRSVDGLRERARLLEEGRRQEVRLELLAERSRISREVHDVVAHSLSGIVAQADGGQYAATRDPARAVEVLAGIATAGRGALDEIRGLLAMLRETPDAGEHDDPGAGPQPGTEDIPVLVAQVRAGGLPVELEVTGTPRELPAGPALTAYRVVQEGLTNAVKHAGPGTPTRVGLDWGLAELCVVIRDDGARTPRPAPPPGGGHGLVGMRERAALHGGRVETGPRHEGGYAVRMRLPYPAADVSAP